MVLKGDTHFVLLGTLLSCVKKLVFVERTDEIIDEMKSDDYEHLIQTFDKYFGMIVDLER